VAVPDDQLHKGVRGHKAKAASGWHDGHLSGLSKEHGSRFLPSLADWVSINEEGGYDSDSPPADGTKVIIADTDHIWGIGRNREWVWSYLRAQSDLHGSL
jgi:hypothetical protein